MENDKTRLLPCKLTEAEKIRFGWDNAREVELWEQTEADKKASAADFKDRIDKHQAKVRRLSAIVSSGVEFRYVEVENRMDFANGTVTVIRVDTNEVVETRQMTKEEQQRQLDFMSG